MAHKIILDRDPGQDDVIAMLHANGNTDIELLAVTKVAGNQNPDKVTHRDCGFGAMVSRRSGETTDPRIAVLAVAAGCGQIDPGAPVRSERVSKYSELNGLIELESAAPDMAYGLEGGAQ